MNDDPTGSFIDYRVFREATRRGNRPDGPRRGCGCANGMFALAALVAAAALAAVIR